MVIPLRTGSMSRPKKKKYIYNKTTKQNRKYMLYLALYCTNTIILSINIFWEKMPEKWMTKD
jgi:hypothetical protein